MQGVIMGQKEGRMMENKRKTFLLLLITLNVFSAIIMCGMENYTVLRCNLFAALIADIALIFYEKG